jgi:glycerol-3-phosphate acyltransferase PlsY
MLEVVLIVLAAYLWGAVPWSYLAARHLKGIDIRDYGSGNVGSSNLMKQAGLRTGIAVGSVDSLVKGTLPVVAVRALDQSLEVQVGVGLAVIAGHNWSVYIGFTGGRGLATSMGVLFGQLLWAELLAWLALIAFGRLVPRDTAMWTLIGTLVAPVLALVMRLSGLAERPDEIVYMLAAIALLLTLKRVTANWERSWTDRHGLARVLARRLLWDRDLPRKETWTLRRPPSDLKG